MSYRRREVIEADPIAKSVKIFHELDRGNEWAVETKYDVTDIIESNKADFAATGESVRWGKPGEVWAKVASIPSHIYYKAIKDKEFDADDDQSLLRWIENRDRLHFRTRQGRLT